ncbi:disease resistance protein (TIR-NBS-LRR class) [Medicago truncatula]|uniref:Disease resistance protein (TIR-NBS-LRR class) n=1 Tax=Medicago truncatula TaxID=3880 RepID=A0A072U5X5_MEDTR|nr:disease resistance protein (TIR-NBS-LRR class) [Medicago truncatula]
MDIVGAILGGFKEGLIDVLKFGPTRASETNTETLDRETLDRGLLRSNDVFLSFRGEDTRASIVSHLYASLLNAGVFVFMDDDSLPRGDHIATSLLQAIEESIISVIVFSKNYADSSWCLNELVKIMECRRTIGQIVLPVFYDVDPSDVRHQTGEFGKAFQSLLSRISKKTDKSLKWRDALSEVAGLAGFVVPNFRNESEAIKDIVKKVVRLLDKKDLFVANHSVGVEPRVQDMMQLLDKEIQQDVGFEYSEDIDFEYFEDILHLPDIQQSSLQKKDIQQSNNVRLIGMWGMGGIGKTTIAKAIYNKIGRNFEGRSFLANIREVWMQNVGQVSLQQQLLSDICKETTTNIQNIDAGKNTLMDRLCHKKVLIVLDDVSTSDQLNALCGSCEWFGPGSRIIITTRDKHILKEIGVYQVYEMKEMNENESMELFSWHAFKQARPKKDFAALSKNVVEYSGGLPLALEVLGSHLFDRMVTEWESVLNKLKAIPNHQVQKKLRISYDGLSDYTEKEIFLDVACFFIGMVRNDVVHILDGCDLYAGIGINVLVERSLVTVDDRNRLRMHDLLRDMGREIVREKSQKNIDECSRLWSSKNVLHVLSKRTGTKVEGLSLKLPRANVQCFNTEAFEKMEKLRLFQLAGVELDGNFDKLSKNLRWFSWDGFPLTSIPSSFYQGNLVSLELENSNVKFLWKKAQTPDFSIMPNLEKLILKDCPRLREVSHSIGHLDKILLINLEDCISLSNLPRSIYKLKSLKTLILSGCSMINKLEEDLEQMESLTTLLANDTGITSVPFSIVRSKSIGYISLCGHEGFSRDIFPSIIWSWMSPTSALSSPFETSAAMSSLVSLDIPCSSSQELSSISNHLSRLRSLWVECGSELQLSEDAKIILDALYATISKEMDSTSATSKVSNMKTSALVQHCSQLRAFESKNLLKSVLLQLGMNSEVTNNLKENILKNMDENGCGGCLFPSDSCPDWLTFNCEGSSVMFEVPQVEGRTLKTLMICIDYSTTLDNITSNGLANLLVKNYTKATIQLYKSEALVSFEDEEGQRVVSSIEPCNKVEVVSVFENGFIVKKTTVYLVYDEPIRENMEQCQEQEENDIVCSSGDEDECY